MAGASPTVGEQAAKRKAVPTLFLTKTYQLVDDPDTDHIVSWGDERVSTIIVWRPADFARDILPSYFRHNNFASFVRQLNAYGFRKVVHVRWEFGNQFFRKGKELLCNIHRGTPTTGTASPLPLLFFAPPHPFHPSAPHQHMGPVVPSPSATEFLQELGLQCVPRKRNENPVSGAALSQSGGSTTFSRSLTLTEEPSPQPPLQQTTGNCGARNLGSNGTAPSCATMLFGVHIGTKSPAATEEAVQPHAWRPAKKPRLALEAAADLSLTLALPSVASSPTTTG